MSQADSLPSPSSFPITGHMWPFVINPFKLLETSKKECGEIFRLRLGSTKYIVISNLEDLKHVLIKNSKNYSRSRTRSSIAMEDISGQSLLTTEGNEWKKRRLFLSPFFNSDYLEQYRPKIQKICTEFVQKWINQSNKVIHLQSEMSSLTVKIASCLFFGSDLNNNDHQLEHSLDNVLKHHWARLKYPKDLAHKIPNPQRKRFKDGMKYIDGLTTDLISNQNTSSQHLLSKMLLEKPDFINLHDEVKTLLLAGHDTTSCTLSWACALLTKHPEWQSKVAEEVHQTTRPNTQALYNEVMRLYPPIWLLERQALKEDTIKGFKINSGDSILIAPWLLHRDERFWDEPNKFKPERFLAIKKNPEYFIPFGLGQHTCIGSSLAMLEAELFLPTLLQSLTLQQSQHKLEPKAGLTLKIKGDLYLNYDLKANS